MVWHVKPSRHAMPHRRTFRDTCEMVSGVGEGQRGRAVQGRNGGRRHSPGKGGLEDRRLMGRKCQARQNSSFIPCFNVML